MPILWLAPGEDEQPHRPVCGLHATQDRQAAFRVSAAAERIHRSATESGGEDMGDDDPKFGPVATTAFWTAALLTSWALIVVAVRTVARLATLVGLL